MDTKAAASRKFLAASTARVEDRSRTRTHTRLGPPFDPTHACKGLGRPTRLTSFAATSIARPSARSGQESHLST